MTRSDVASKKLPARARGVAVTDNATVYRYCPTCGPVKGESTRHADSGITGKPICLNCGRENNSGAPIDT